MVLLTDGVLIALVIVPALMASERGLSIVHRATGEKDDRVLVSRLRAELRLLIRKAIVVLLVDLVESVGL